jgi:predicted permease
MTRLRLLGWRLLGLFGRRRMEKEMDDEIQSHLAMQADDNERRGMAAEDARLAARRSFGNLDVVKEQHRDKRGLRIFDQLIQDTRHATRSLLRRPVHTLTAALCLAVGLTVSIIVFSVLVSFFFGDQPGVSERGRIVQIHLRYGSEAGTGTVSEFSLADFHAFEATVPALKNTAAEADLVFAVLGDHDALGVRGAFVSGDYFRLLQTQVQRGRRISKQDDLSGAPATAVVSDYFWRTELDGSEKAIGQSILVSGRSVVVIGVAPPRFHGLTSLEVGEDDSKGRQIWLPLAHAVGWPGAPSAHTEWLTMIGRLADGRTAQQAEAQLTAPAAALAERHVEWNSVQAILLRIGEGIGVGLADVLLIICAVLSAPLAVLAVSCANVANLQLGRATERIREIAVRVSFGATRAQVIRLLTIETIGFAILSLVISTAATVAVFKAADGFFPRILTIDWRVALFSVVLMLAVTFASGVAPAWIVLRRSTTPEILKQTRQTSGAVHSRLRSALVVVQVAVSLAMLCGNGLFMESLRYSQFSVPPAMRSQLIADFDPRQLGSSLPQHFSEELTRRVAADPRVEAVSLSRRSGVRYFTANDAPDMRRFAPLAEITPAWLGMMEATVLAGRALTEQDGPGNILLSKSFADSLNDSGDVLGRMLRLQTEEGGERSAEVVGIVSDVQLQPMLPGQTPEPTMYSVFRPAAHPFTLWIKSSKLDEVSGELRRIVRELDPRMPWLGLRRGEEIFLRGAPTIRYLALAVGGLGLLALALAVIGLYAVMSYLVLLRRHEVSVRIAIGAKSKDIVLMMMRHALQLVLVGTTVGLMLTVMLALVMRTVVFGVIAFNPLSFLPQIALIMSATLIAASIPAYFAARVDPMQVLKED